MNDSFAADETLIVVDEAGVWIDLGPEHIPELKKILDRALNTWDPQKAPKWAIWLSERL
jgi:hypothetical protein